MNSIHDRIYRFLALFARADCDAAYLQRLVQETVRFESELPQLDRWDWVVDQAEALGVAPLLYIHLKKVGVSLPLDSQRKLQGLYLRHRHANQVKTRVLREILTAFDTAGIKILVLKGGSLSHIIYPEPGLRPMGDLDIFVPKSEVWRAQGLLVDHGFHISHLPSASISVDGDLRHSHLPQATFPTDGVSIDVEIHHNLFEPYESHSAEIDGLIAPSLPFSLEPEGVIARTLGYEDMLWHLCLHLCKIRHRTSFLGDLRLIWVADIISFAEHFVEKIDWEKIKCQYPSILSTLSLLHFMTPLSEALLTKAAISIGPKPKGIGENFRGWPTLALGDERVKKIGYGRFLYDTFLPSEWWLRLYYGLGTAQKAFWYRWVRHPLHILKHTLDTIRNISKKDQ